MYTVGVLPILGLQVLVNVNIPTPLQPRPTLPAGVPPQPKVEVASNACFDLDRVKCVRGLNWSRM